MYSVRVLRRAIKDIANLPKEYTRLVSQRVDLLGKNPRPQGAKKLRGTMDYSLRVGVYRILYEGVSPREAVGELMGRELTSE